MCSIVVYHGQPDFLGSPGDPEGGLENLKGPRGCGDLDLILFFTYFVAQDLTIGLRLYFA